MNLIQQMTREDFEKVPYRKDWDSIEKPFNSLVIIPTEKLHDSGWRIMEFVAVDKNDDPIAKVSVCADVLEIDGIGGYGKRNSVPDIPKFRPVEGWRIDCLPKSGYLRLFNAENDGIECGNDISNFEIFFRDGEQT